MTNQSVDRLIAVSTDDVQQWGCPYCGYRSAHRPLSVGTTSLFVCGDCKVGFVVLGPGTTKSAFSFDDFYPELEEHPRKGIPAHGKPDVRPDGGGEFFRSRGIGLDDCSCFVCGTHDRDGQGHVMLNNIAAFVQTKEAGDRVVEMFSQKAWVDYRDFEPDRVQVKIGACDEHLPNLERLDHMVRFGVITPEMVALASK